MAPLTLTVDELTITTHGLVSIGRPELRFQVGSRSEIEEGNFLFHLAGWVVSSGSRLESGDRFIDESHAYRFKGSHRLLEVLLEGAADPSERPRPRRARLVRARPH